MDYYEAYFVSQIGGGGDGGGYTRRGGIGPVFVGSPHQRGHGGIGSFLAGLFRRVLPLLSRGAKAVGKEALRTGMNIVSDVTTQNTPIRESFKNRVRESGENLKRKAEEKLDKLMEGSGYKKARYLAIPQSIGSSGVVKTRKRKKKSNRKHKSSGIKKTVKGKKKRRVQKKKKKNPRTTRDIFG